MHQPNRIESFYKTSALIDSGSVAETTALHQCPKHPLGIKIKQDNWELIMDAPHRMVGADCCSSLPAYQLLHRSIQVTNMVARNDANLALSPTFRYVSIESPL
ncbi:hypothetical protein TNCV_1830141 [Trichonephila clavipes]|nr:hypothetical protein TNCV_1830141 [Trichonephila clavipes]